MGGHEEDTRMGGVHAVCQDRTHCARALKESARVPMHFSVVRSIFRVLEN